MPTQNNGSRRADFGEEVRNPPMHDSVDRGTPLKRNKNRVLKSKKSLTTYNLCLGVLQPIISLRIPPLMEYMRPQVMYKDF